MEPVDGKQRLGHGDSERTPTRALELSSSSSARRDKSKSERSPPPAMRLHVGEIKFEASPSKLNQSLRSEGTYGMSGALPPVPFDHAKTNEQLLAQRRQRMEGAGVVRQARSVTLEEEEEAYALFKRSHYHSASGSLHQLPSLPGDRRGRDPPDTAPSPSKLRTQTSPYSNPTNNHQSRWRRGDAGLHSPGAPPKDDGRLGVGPTSQQRRPSPLSTTIVSYNNRDPRPTHTNRPLFLQRTNSRLISSVSPHSLSQASRLSGSPNPSFASNSKSFDYIPSSPNTPPPMVQSDARMSPTKAIVPTIRLNFRVQSVTAADPLEGESGSGRLSPSHAHSRFASPQLSAKGDGYTSTNYYCGYHCSGTDGGGSSSVRSESLPYWALPPLPIGTSDTPRLASVSPSTESVVDTARNDERAAAWRVARREPQFRGRVVLNTSAERSKVDLAAADIPWNERFQSLLDLPCVTPQDAKGRVDAIASLQEEFRDAVLPIVEAIIIERDTENKSIALEPMGGVAGGDKYACGQIIVKFASSRKMIELYGSHDHAMKSVVNELKGLNGLAASDVPLLHYPLGMLVKFMGHYVWACTRIPISESTLCSGSRDGGRTVVEARDPGAKAILEALGSSLNLKRHRVGRDLIEICGPVDLEIHCGLDGRYYALDTARLYPPDASTSLGTSYNFHLYRSLRHELVVQWPEPLSSDAYSPFGRDRKSEHDDDVLTASMSLNNYRIPALIAEVDRQLRSITVRDEWHVSEVLHARGINVRYIALILDGYLKHCGTTAARPHQPFVTHMAAEIVARCFASMTRTDLLAVSSDDASLTPYHAVLVERFNQLLCGGSGDVESYWRRIGAVAADKFAAPLQLRRALESLGTRKTMQLANISEDWFHHLLWKRASSLLGVAWHMSPERDAAWIDRLGASSSDLFSVPLIARVSPVVKMFHMNSENLSHSLVAAGRLGDAESRYMAELKVRVSVLGDTPPIVPLLHCIAELYAMPAWGAGRPRLADALEFSERSVRIFQRMHDAFQESMTATLAAMATPTTTAESDDGIGAASAQDASRTTLPPPLPCVFWEGYVASLANYGRLLRESGRVKEALDGVGTALQLYAENGVDNRRLCASLHSSQALSWRRLGHYVESFESAQAAAAVAESMHLTLKSTFGSLRYAEALCLLAEAAHRLGHRKDAHRHSSEAMSLVHINIKDIAALRETTPRQPLDDDAIDSNASASASHSSAALSNPTAAMVFTTWVEVRLDGIAFEEPDKSIGLETIRWLLEVARTTFAHSYGLRSYEGLKSLLLEARVLKLQGHYLQGTRVCEEALSHADYLYGKHSWIEAQIYLTLAEFSFLPMVEHPQERHQQDDDDCAGTARLSIARAHLSKAFAILATIKDETTPTFAYATVMEADLTRVDPRSTQHHIGEALAKATHAVTLLESLQLHNATSYVYAMNVAALLRIQVHRHASVIPDLLRVLASSDRFMMVADSDYFTQETILLCQSKHKQSGAAGRCKIVLSHDGYLRKLSGRLQLVSLLLAHDELLNAALIAKEIALLMRQLFPPSASWSEERAAFLPLIAFVGEELLRRTGNVLGPVTDIGLGLRRIAEEEDAQRRDFEAAEALKARSEEQQAVADHFRMRQERLTSQTKQVGTYFGTRAFHNGFSLLHALLDSFQELYPDGASRTIPHSIATHNLIVQHILFARNCIEGTFAHSDGRVSSALEGLLQAEDHAVDVLRCPVTIQDPSTFDGFSDTSGCGLSSEGPRRSLVEDSIATFRIGFDDSESTAAM